MKDKTARLNEKRSKIVKNWLPYTSFAKDKTEVFIRILKGKRQYFLMDWEKEKEGKIHTMPACFDCFLNPDFSLLKF